VAATLAPLRRDLDAMPSPVEGRPGLLLRDPLGYSQAVLVVPPGLVPALACFDGRHTEMDLRELLVRATGELEVSDLLQRLVTTLASSGFLEDDSFARLRDERRRHFAEAPRREAAHAGSAYPAEADGLTATLARYMDGAVPEDAPARPDGTLVGIAAPHVSPEGGWRSYRAAYRLLGPDLHGRTCVVLGTSHYGEPGRFGLTRKPFSTPLGDAAVDRRLVEELAGRGGPAVALEDYCHAVEHSIEFQVVFLQHALGPDIRIVPILCGPLVEDRVEKNESVGRFLAVLAEIAAREGDEIFWVLGVDMAHMGRRYGDGFDARAGEGRMKAVEREDACRLERIEAGDAGGFWERVQGGGSDNLKWCGSSALYVFLRAAGSVRGERLRYEQWNIDEGSVVSFAGLAFVRRTELRRTGA
jgi:AmmeMemoRadiSam system protein B